MWIENSVTRVTVWHHEAYQVMPNSYPEWRNFQLAPNNHDVFFFLHTLSSTIVLKIEYALFYQFCAKLLKHIFDQERLGSTTSWCTRSFYTLSCKTEISRTDENRGKPGRYERKCCRVCKKKLNRTQFFVSFTSKDKTYLTRPYPIRVIDKSQYEHVHNDTIFKTKALE